MNPEYAGVHFADFSLLRDSFSECWGVNIARSLILLSLG